MLFGFSNSAALEGTLKRSQGGSHVAIHHIHPSGAAAEPRLTIVKVPPQVRGHPKHPICLSSVAPRLAHHKTLSKQYRWHKDYRQQIFVWIRLKLVCCLQVFYGFKSDIVVHAYDSSHYRG